MRRFDLSRSNVKRLMNLAGKTRNDFFDLVDVILLLRINYLIILYRFFKRSKMVLPKKGNSSSFEIISKLFVKFIFQFDTNILFIYVYEIGNWHEYIAFVTTCTNGCFEPCSLVMVKQMLALKA